jgi:hypothetical protein
MKTTKFQKLFIALGLAALSPSAFAQSSSLPTLSFTGKYYNEIFETNGTDGVLLRFDMALSSASRDPVTFLLSTRETLDSDVADATAGEDFVEFRNFPVTLAAGQTDFHFSVRIKGDTVREGDEQFLVEATNIVGALGTDGRGGTATLGLILNDDGQPRILINNISVSEPINSTKTATFTVSASHPSQTPTTVNFRTRDGTADSDGIAILLRDYFAKTGTLTIPAATDLQIPATTELTVTLRSDTLTHTESTEDFFVDFSNAINGIIPDFNGGKCRIIDNSVTPLTVGGFQISPDNATPALGETVHYSIIWEVPEGEVWRDLNTIDFRIRDKKKTALWVRWEEATNLISLLDTPKTGKKDGEEVANASRSSGIVGTPGDLPGSNVVLEAPLAELGLAESSVVGSGPTGKTVTLNFAVRFLDKAEGRSFILELAATDDLLNEDGFVQAGHVEVQRIRPPQKKK